MLKYPIFYFSEKFRINLNRETDPLFIMFDYSLRSHSVSMKEPHKHDFYEILIPLDEGNAHLVEGTYYKLCANDILLLRPRLNHMSIYEKTKTKISSRILIDFNLFTEVPGLQLQLERMLKPFQSDIPVFRFPSEVLALIIRNLNDIFICGKTKRNGWEIEYYTLFLDFLRIISTSTHLSKYSGKKTDASIEQKIYTICRYIQRYSNEEISLPEVAEEFAMSESYLSRAMKNVAGMTFLEYLQIIRTRNAMLQITFQPKEKMKNILIDSGFTSVAQFNRVFKNITGLCPTDFKRLSRDEQLRITEHIDPDKGEDIERIPPMK